MEQVPLTIDAPLVSPRRESWDSGAVRDQRGGKGRYDLMSVVADDLIAQVMEYGATHYEDRNWEKGIPVMRFVDSMRRHLSKWIAGEELDESGLPHLAHVAWNALALLHMAELTKAGVMPAELDDRPRYGGKFLREALESA